MAKAPIKPITLKELAAMLELSQSTVSRIINGEATAHRIAEETQQRVLHAAALNGYVANTMARGLQVPPWQVGLMLVVPAAVDLYRYLVPRSVWAPWTSISGKMLLLGVSTTF